ncbi:MAG TPA: TonB-dependent receptor, partial [Flavisolibacter sp.]|nr:TonB-dependent receptor [Flavisolibacter sp.]
MKLLLTLLACFLGLGLAAQVNPGILTGNVMDEKSKALENATVELVRLGDTTLKNTLVTDRNGNFQFNRIAFGFYQLRISHLGFQNLVLDSIYFRTERFDFNLTDIQLKTAGAESKMDEVLIYLEKPLVQSKEGNITFNAGESALSAGSNASELLTNVPLVTKDPNGKLLVRGKEPRILIDDKPVELNLQQLQDLLESMPGSSVEKIEVMTNPPPQYANEQGGVINIVTRKGSVGMNGRVSIYAGSRGEGGLNAGFNYRKQGLALNINAGGAINEFDGDGYSRRQNLDPKRFYNTDSRYSNRNLRPNFRMNLNYDLNKFHTLNLALQYNGNSFSNRNWVNYMNLDGQQQIFHLRDRAIRSTGDNFNPNLSLSYTMKTKKPGESIRLISNLNYSSSFLARDFGELYYNPDYTLNRDSTQQQVTDNKTSGYSLRLEYNRPLTKKTSLSLGAYRTLTRSDIEVDAAYLRKSDGSWAELDALTNHFRFRQTVSNLRGSLKQMFGENLSLSAGLNA